MCVRVCVCGAYVCVCACVLMHVHTRVLTHIAVGGMQNGAKINWIRLISLGKTAQQHLERGASVGRL